jgi:hypothetical protein
VLRQKFVEDVFREVFGWMGVAVWLLASFEDSAVDKEVQVQLWLEI